MRLRLLSAASGAASFRSLWRRIAERVYSPAFWADAARRPRCSARPLQTQRDELLRMHRFERRHAAAFEHSWTMDDYRALWRWLDQQQPLDALLPWLCPPLRERA